MSIACLESINRHDWQVVKRKALVKKILKLAHTAGAPVDRVHISPAFGSVYINIGIDWDDEYACFDDVRTIRVADHRRTSGDYASPDINIYDTASFQSSLEELQGIFAEARGE